jgi:hypothetical protein
MKRNDWATQFAAKRRAIDKKLLAEAEAQIPSPDDAAPCTDGRFASQATRTLQTPERPPTLDRNMRLPIDLSDEELNRISRAFGRPVT